MQCLQEGLVGLAILGRRRHAELDGFFGNSRDTFAPLVDAGLEAALDMQGAQ